MEKSILFQGKSIHFKVEGSGPVLVFLHGFLEDISMWNYHSEVLSKEYQVICVDLPGHGETEQWSATHTMEFMAETVLQVLNAEGIDKCVMIGHSMGGYTTLAFAELYPEKLLGFGLFHSHSLSDSEKAKENRDRTIEIVNKEKFGFISQFIPSLYAEENRSRLKVEIEHQIQMAKNMPKESITAALAGMKLRPMRLDVVVLSENPVLFILGKQDSRIPLESVLAQAATPNVSQINILGHSGHMGWQEESETTAIAINGFMKLCLHRVS